MQLIQHNIGMMKYWLKAIIVIWVTQIGAQEEIIPLINPSFEGTPAAGTFERNFILGGWFDCAPYYFRGQTPPDVQPGSMEFFDVTTEPGDGNTYLGMVTRQNETWELVSQRLVMPLEKGKCYEFDIHLARSDTYFSRLLNGRDTTKKLNFNQPVVLRIWGGRNVYEKRELLAESPVITHTDWRNHHFEFHPKQSHDYLILEAFYKTPTLLPYNGNILLDNASDIRRIPCPGEEDYAEGTIAAFQPSVKEVPKRKEMLKNQSEPKADPGKSNTVQAPKNEKELDDLQPRILKDLDKNTIREGQIIKIEQLFFKADSSNFTADSYLVLDEIFEFLRMSPNVVIEIGGHTNGIPGKEYCQDLSLKRAKAVAEYLYEKGIPNNRIMYRGYGKDRPIASNKTHLGRQKNQRVEIKILKIK